MADVRLNRKQINDFWRRRSKINDPLISTHFKIDDANEYDFNFILKFLKPPLKVLDLGCGTCYVTRRVAEKVSYVKAIDKHSQFIKKCPKLANLVTDTADILTYIDDDTYDIILLFGIMNYFNDLEASKIYKNAYSMLKEGGKLLVKHACGIDEDVLINAYSEQIKDQYHALYRFVDREEELLREYFSEVEVVDIYPDHLNKWKNTHYYAFIASN